MPFESAKTIAKGKAAMLAALPIAAQAGRLRRKGEPY
jgi:hypothetical protein